MIDGQFLCHPSWSRIGLSRCPKWSKRHTLRRDDSIHLSTGTREGSSATVFRILTIVVKNDKFLSIRLITYTVCDEASTNVIITRTRLNEDCTSISVKNLTKNPESESSFALWRCEKLVQQPYRREFWVLREYQKTLLRECGVLFTIRYL